MRKRRRGSNNRTGHNRTGQPDSRVRDVVVVVVCLVRGDELFVCVCVCGHFPLPFPPKSPLHQKKDMKTIGRIPFLGCFAHTTCDDLVRLSISRFHLSSFDHESWFDGGKSVRDWMAAK